MRIKRIDLDSETWLVWLDSELDGTLFEKLKVNRKISMVYKEHKVISIDQKYAQDELAVYCLLREYLDDQEDRVVSNGGGI